MWGGSHLKIVGQKSCFWCNMLQAKEQMILIIAYDQLNLPSALVRSSGRVGWKIISRTSTSTKQGVRYSAFAHSCHFTKNCSLQKPSS
jgi:hypothetical protein